MENKLYKDCLLLVCGHIRGTQQSCVVKELHVSTVCKVRSDVPISYLIKAWIGEKSKNCLPLRALVVHLSNLGNMTGTFTDQKQRNAKSFK